MTPGIAAQLWTFHDLAARDLEGVITRIGELGYRAVEPLGLHGRSPQAIRALLDSVGMTLSSVHAPFPAGPDASRILDEQAELGATTLIWSLEKAEFDDPALISRGVERINAAVPRAAAYGMRIGYHNHYAEFANSFGGRTAYDILLDQLDPAVVIELDLYWAALGGADPAEIVARLGERLEFLHVKDGPVRSAEDYLTPVGQGRVDIDGALTANPFVRWHIVELDRCRIDQFDALRQSYRYLVGRGLSAGRLAGEDLRQ